MTKALDDSTPPETKDTLRAIYQQRGFQQQPLEEYIEVRKIQEQRKGFRLPPALQFILTTPFILLFCLGLIFIPFMFYLSFTSGS